MYLYIFAHAVRLVHQGTTPTLSLSNRGTSLMRNKPLLGPYSRTMCRAIWWPEGGGLFLMSEVTL